MGHLKLGIVGGLGLGGRDVPERLEEAAVVEPVDPFEGGKLDRFEAAPGAAPMDQLGFVEAVDGFGEGVIVAITDAANRRLDTRRGKPLGILDRDVLHTAIAVMDEAAAPDGPALVQGLLQRVQHEAGVSRAGDTPADDAPCKGVDDEGDIDETGPRRDVGKVGHPQGVRTRRFELPIDVIERTRGRRIADCGADPFAPHHALQPHRPHQARYGAASDRGPFPEKLSPDLPDAIDSEVLIVHAPDFGPQGDIAPRPCGQLTRISAPGGVGAIRRRGDRQNAADRLDPVAGAVLVDKGDHGLNRRSSSAWAKYADAFRRISFAWRSSRFSRSSALMRSRSSVVGPSRTPWSGSACRTQ